MSARCVDDGQVVYLAVSRNAAPSDRRASDITSARHWGDLIFDSNFWPDWGLHLVDVNLTMDNLLGIVGDEIFLLIR